MSTRDFAGLLPGPGVLTPRMVDRWIEAALAEAAALREHDGSLYPPGPTAMPDAQRLHDAWRDWAEDARVLCDRAKAMRATGAKVAGLEELCDALGRALGVVAMPPARIAERREQAERGDVHPFEEVRRELRASRGR